MASPKVAVDDTPMARRERGRLSRLFGSGNSTTVERTKITVPATTQTSSSNGTSSTDASEKAAAAESRRLGGRMAWEWTDEGDQARDPRTRRYSISGPPPSIRAPPPQSASATVGLAPSAARRDDPAFKPMTLVRPSFKKKTETEEMMEKGLSEEEMMAQKRRELEMKHRQKAKAQFVKDSAPWRKKQEEEQKKALEQAELARKREEEDLKHKRAEEEKRRKAEEQFQKERENQMFQESVKHSAGGLDTEAVVKRAELERRKQEEEFQKEREKAMLAEAEKHSGKEEVKEAATTVSPRTATETEEARKERARLKGMWLSVEQ